MKNLLVSLVLVPTFFVGCSESSTNVPYNPNQRIIRTTDNKDDIERFFKESSVVCAEDSCPNNVVKLSFYQRMNEGDYGFGVCSGTLIKPGLILTNAHCIPNNLKRVGADCSKQIQVKFPGPIKFRVDTETVKCQRVRNVFNNENGQPDLALIEVDRSRKTRLPVTIASNEPAIGETVHAYTMNPSSSSLAGFIRKKTCLMLEENNLFENEFTGQGMVFSIGDKSTQSCKIIGGNSGSGLFNDKNELVGAIYAKVDETALLPLLSDAGFKKNFNFKFNFIGMAVNMKCLESIQYAFDPACPITKDENLTSLVDLIEKIRLSEGHQDTPDTELYVTIDKNLRYGVKTAPNGLFSLGSNFMYIPYGDFITAESLDSELSAKLKSLAQPLTLLKKAHHRK